MHEYKKSERKERKGGEDKMRMLGRKRERKYTNEEKKRREEKEERRGENKRKKKEEKREENGRLKRRKLKIQEHITKRKRWNKHKMRWRRKKSHRKRVERLHWAWVRRIPYGGEAWRSWRLSEEKDTADCINIKLPTKYHGKFGEEILAFSDYVLDCWRLELKGRLAVCCCKRCISA